MKNHTFSSVHLASIKVSISALSDLVSDTGTLSCTITEFFFK